VPRVLNLHKDEIPEDAVYVGRPSSFGNPFHRGEGMDRIDTIQKYKEWVLSQPEMVEKIKRELKGKDLVCFCRPKPCHASVLLNIANPPEDEAPKFEYEEI
jgi:hypothetical protein